MGMYFNSAQTAKMVARLNIHFGPTDGGGLIDAKRQDAALFKKSGGRKLLHVLADKYKIYVDPQEDLNGKHQTNWGKWLDLIEDSKKAASETLDPVPIPPETVGPKTGPQNSTVAKEIGQLIYQGLKDTNCGEIVFVVLPSTTLSVDQPQTYGRASAYSLVITVRTAEITALLRRARAKRQQRNTRKKV